MLKKVLNYSIIAFLLLSFNTVCAEPVVNSIDGTFNHGGTITVNGAGFGIKSPAAPLLWDDCEDKTVNNYNTLLSEGGYSEARPSSGTSDSHVMQYRNVLYRNVPGPHSRSTKYLAGGHEEMGGTQWARNVHVTFAAPTPSKTWWASWYVRLDPNWPAGGDGVNYKNWVVQTARSAYGGDCASCGYRSLAYFLDRDWVLGAPTQEVLYNGTIYRNNANFGPYQFDIHRQNGGRHANEAFGWVKMEGLIAKNEVGEYGERAYSDWSSVGNGWAWYKGNVPNWEFSHGDFDPLSFTVGGYWRKALDGGAVMDNDAFRYFDDIYIDTSLARAVLGNAPNYDDITIMEPQIPSVWSDDSITCTVNLGRLPASGVAYLFVFDADNNHNSEGYPVNINYSEGGIGTAQLDAPTGLEIVDIEN